MASSLPEELLQEILVRLPPDEPVHLARASLVCKSWRRVLTDRDCFLRRCRGFHGAPPPLLGYIQNRYDDNLMQFVPANSSSAISPARMPALDCRRYCLAIDCRHGRVLIHFDNLSKRRLIVWDPITGSQQHLRLPSSSSTSHSYTGAVLCAKHGCDHLDCQASGPFRVVFVEANLPDPTISACASSYSSLTGVWSAPAPNYRTNHNSIRYYTLGNRKQSLVIGDAIYFPFECSISILKYDMCTHRLSEISMPLDVSSPTLMKAEDGGLGLASLTENNHIHIWSRQDVVTNGIGEWVEQRVMEVETLLPRCIPADQAYQGVVGFAEGTNTIFMNISTGIFTLDLKSKEVRKVGERDAERSDIIFPYMRFYAPSCCAVKVPKL